MNLEFYNELKELSPLLAQLKEKDPFKVPADYFYKLESTIEVALSDEANFGDSGFKVPEGYFDDLHKQVLGKTKQNQTPIRSIFWKATIGLAASFALFWIFSGTINSNNDPSHNLVFSEDESWEYINENLDYFDREELIDLISSESDFDYLITLDEEEEVEYLLEDLIENISDDELESLL